MPVLSKAKDSQSSFTVWLSLSWLLEKLSYELVMMTSSRHFFKGEALDYSVLFFLLCMLMASIPAKLIRPIVSHRPI